MGSMSHFGLHSGVDDDDSFKIREKERGRERFYCRSNLIDGTQMGTVLKFDFQELY